MTRRAVLAIAFSLALAATGCAGFQADMQRADASDVEASLRGAGFVLIPSDTPQRIESMRTLPPLVFSQVEGEVGIVEMQADLWDPDWAGIDD
jgi:hypothetical protein